MLLRAAASHGRSLAFAAAAGSLVAWQSRSDRVECKKLLTPLQAADVSNLVLEQYQVPLVPHSIQLVLVQRVVDLLASEIEKNTDAEDSKLAAWFQQAQHVAGGPAAAWSGSRAAVRHGPLGAF